METWESIIKPILYMLSGVAASSGFWAYLMNRDCKRIEQNEKARERELARDEMLLGLGHDRIMYLSDKFLDRGEITADEYENLHGYLYTPYKKMGGNGTAERNMEKVYSLKVKSSRAEQREEANK